MSLANRLAPKLLRFLSDKDFARIQCLWHQKQWPRIENPRTFNDKIQWLKLYWRDERLPRLVDKWAVRSFVEERLSRDYLIPAIGVYDRPEDIPWDELPEQFVLKATHGSGWNIICRDRSEFDREEACKKLSGWLDKNFYSIGREWAYTQVPPRIIAEEYLSDLEGEHPLDFKIFCFHGEPLYVQVDYDRYTRHTRNLFDRDLKRLECSYEYPVAPERRELPGNMPELFEKARALSEGFPFVRVDLYSVKGQIYFGEMTFYPEKGVGVFDPPSYDLEFGKHLDLTKCGE